MTVVCLQEVSGYKVSDYEIKHLFLSGDCLWGLSRLITRGCHRLRMRGACISLWVVSASFSDCLLLMSKVSPN